MNSEFEVHTSLEKRKEYNLTYPKSKVLISSVFKSNLTENKILAYAFSRIKLRDYTEDKEGAITVKLRARELRDIFEANNDGGFYARLKSVARLMAGRVIGIEDPENHEFGFVSFIEKCLYVKGEMIIEFSKYMKSYLINFTSPYSKLWLDEMIKYDSVYSFRLAEMLHSEAYTPAGMKKRTSWQVEYNLAELKFKLGVANGELSAVKNILNNSNSPDYEKALEVCSEKKYDKFCDLKKRCIVPAVEELNNKSDLDISYELKTGGKGGKVYSIIFYMRLKDDSNGKAVEEPLAEIDKDDVLERIMDLMQIKLKDARNIAEAAAYDFTKIEEKYEIAAGQEIDNIVGWMIAAIKNDYQQPVRKKKITSKPEVAAYTDEDGREYTYAELATVWANKGIH